jgi:tetratricopeptide (TPR) repeat protein
LIISKRATLKTELDTRKLEESKKREFDIFMEAGDAAFKSSNWTLAETKYNEAAKLYPTDQRVKSQQQKIVSEKQKAQEEVKNKASYDKAIQEANVFVNQKKYSEAIGKYNEALKFQPNQKAFIDGEIIKIKGGQSDEALEIAVKKDLKTASELANQLYQISLTKI